MQLQFGCSCYTPVINSFRMPAASLSPTLAAPDVETVLRAIRVRGLRATAARRVLIEALFAAAGPVTASEIADGLGGRVPGADPAAVYRNLELLERVGLVRHTHAGHGPALYTLADRVASEFLRCEQCGELRALPPSALAVVRDAVRAETGWEARFTHFPLVGLCPPCATGLRGEGAR